MIFTYMDGIERNIVVNTRTTEQSSDLMTRILTYQSSILGKWCTVNYELELFNM
jgi:hypothetical protein